MGLLYKQERLQAKKCAVDAHGEANGSTEAANSSQILCILQKGESNSNVTDPLSPCKNSTGIASIS